MRCHWTQLLMILLPTVLILFVVSRIQNRVNIDASFTVRDLKPIDRSVFESFGFETVEYSQPLPVLKRIAPLNCNQIFGDWLDYNEKAPKFSKPPREIPASMEKDYLMNGRAFKKEWYINEMTSKTKYWGKDSIQRLVDSKKVYVKYDPDGLAVYYATLKHSVKNMTGLVVGSYTPWAEAVCIRNGADKMFTIDYQNARSDHPKVEFINAFELARNWTEYSEKFDFVVSFSSIEHSGLGRYGDPLDPMGDIKEMQKIRCLLKPNGLFFFGVPVGLDAVVFNVHRIYGRARLPMMFEGYRLIDIFHRRLNKTQDELPLTHDSSKGEPQFVFVLRKE